MKTGHKWNHPKDHQAVPECKKCNQSLWNAATTVCKGDLVALVAHWRKDWDWDKSYDVGMRDGFREAAYQLEALLNTEGGKQ